jgi:glucose-6-phosphate isomerase
VYEQIFDTCLSEAIGPQGLEEASFRKGLEAAGRALERLGASTRPDERAVLDLPARRDDLEAVAEHVGHIRQTASDVVIFGIGGSSLGGQAVTAIVKNSDASAGPAGPRLHFAENPDPVSLAYLLDTVPLSTTHFLAISKSGGTPEPLAQLFAAMAKVRADGGDLSERFTVVTEPATKAEPQGNLLRRLATRHGMTALDHDPALGGRFSVLSIVGLIPAMLAGLDPISIRAGAAQVLKTLGGKPEDCPPAVGAAIAAGLEQERGLRVSVMFPYADALDRFAMWYRQLWAESLGKAGHGTVPVRALGPVDQHSQLQLYLDGPNDKLFTFLAPDWRGQGPRIDPGLADDPALNYLAGRTVGDLVAAEARATAETLAKAGRPVRVFRLAGIGEQTLGALFMHFILETILAAELLGVDPFGQAAVEAGKKLTRAYLLEAGA